MFTEDYQEKTEPASPRKKEEARNSGYIPLSTELNSAFTLLGFFLISAVLFFVLLSQTKWIFHHRLDNIIQSEINLQSIYHLFLYELTSFFKIILPLILIPLAIGIISSLLQTNFLLTFRPLFLAGGRFYSTLSKHNRLGFRLTRIFSLRTFMEAIKLTFKILAVILIGYFLIRQESANLISLSERGAGDFIPFLSFMLLKMGLCIVVLFILLGIGDYLFQRWQYEKDLRMSREELKRELKEEEGSPEVKGRLRDFLEKVSSKYEG